MLHTFTLLLECLVASALIVQTFATPCGHFPYGPSIRKSLRNVPAVPWNVLIEERAPGLIGSSVTCVGTVLPGKRHNSTDTVVTAGDCFMRKRTVVMPHLYTVLTGISRYLGKHSPSQSYGIKRIRILKFKGMDGARSGFALLKLQRPILYSSDVSAVCLPETELNLNEPTSCLVTELDRVMMITRNNVKPKLVTVGPCSQRTKSSELCSIGDEDTGKLGTALACYTDQQRWELFGVLLYTTQGWKGEETAVYGSVNVVNGILGNRNVNDVEEYAIIDEQVFSSHTSQDLPQSNEEASDEQLSDEEFPDLATSNYENSTALSSDQLPDPIDVGETIVSGGLNASDMVFDWNHLGSKNASEESIVESFEILSADGYDGLNSTLNTTDAFADDQQSDQVFPDLSTSNYENFTAPSSAQLPDQIDVNETVVSGGLNASDMVFDWNHFGSKNAFEESIVESFEILIADGYDGLNSTLNTTDAFADDDQSDQVFPDLSTSNYENFTAPSSAQFPDQIDVHVSMDYEGQYASDVVFDWNNFGTKNASEESIVESFEILSADGYDGLNSTLNTTDAFADPLDELIDAFANWTLFGKPTVEKSLNISDVANETNHIALHVDYASRVRKVDVHSNIHSEAPLFETSYSTEVPTAWEYDFNNQSLSSLYRPNLTYFDKTLYAGTPWFVALVNPREYPLRVECTGSLLETFFRTQSDMVLTSEDCVSAAQRKQFIAVMGQNMHFGASSSKVLMASGKKIKSVLDDNTTTISGDRRLHILKLSEPVTFMSTVLPLHALPPVDAKDVYSRCFVSGIHHTGGVALMRARMFDHQWCTERLGTTAFDDVRQLCAVVQKDLLTLHLGAPLSCRLDNGWYQFGAFLSAFEVAGLNNNEVVVTFRKVGKQTKFILSQFTDVCPFV